MQVDKLKYFQNGQYYPAKFLGVRKVGKRGARLRFFIMDPESGFTTNLATDTVYQAVGSWFHDIFGASEEETEDAGFMVKVDGNNIGYKSVFDFYREEISIPEKTRKFMDSWQEGEAGRAYDKRYECKPRTKRKEAIREATRRVLRGRGTEEDQKLLGCDTATLREHLAKSFKEGWVLEDYGTKWHMDHIMPLASASTFTDLDKLAHYKNLQALSPEENNEKLDKVYHN